EPRDSEFDAARRPGMTSSSCRRAAAVNRVMRAGNIARIVRGEEGDDGCDFGCLSEPPRRNAVDDPVLRRRFVAAGAALQDGRQHAAVDQAGADAIDPYAGAGAFP